MRIVMYQDKTFEIVGHTTVQVNTNPIIAEADIDGKTEAEIEQIKQQLLDANS